jgi:hypothetical protein
MKIVLSFTRVFTRGNLCGLEHLSKLNFESEERAIDWLERVSKNCCDYKIKSWNISNA